MLRRPAPVIGKKKLPAREWFLICESHDDHNCWRSTPTLSAHGTRIVLEHDHKSWFTVQVVIIADVSH